MERKLKFKNIPTQSMRPIIIKITKSKSILKWVQEILTLYLLKLISKLIAKSRKKYIAIIANDHIGNEISVKGYYAEEEMNLLKNIALRANQTKGSFVDIGANIGNHSVFFSDIFNEVHAFEPNPLIFPVLKANSEIHENIKVYNLGLGYKKDKKLMHINRKNLGASHVRQYFSKVNKPFIASHKIKIEITKLDNFIEKIGEVSLMKLDVEGMEYVALQGAQETINRFKPIIQFELLAQNYKTPKIFKFLETYGYSFYEIFNEYELKPFFIRRLINIRDFLKNKKSISVELKKIFKLKKKNYVIIALQNKHLKKIKKNK